MLSASEWPRTRIVTCSAHRDRCIAACPAELPPPTTNTFRPRMAAASLTPAP